MSELDWKEYMPRVQAVTACQVDREIQIDIGGEFATTCVGDWIVCDEDGELDILNDEAFRAVFRPVVTVGDLLKEAWDKSAQAVPESATWARAKKKGGASE